MNDKAAMASPCFICAYLREAGGFRTDTLGQRVWKWNNAWSHDTRCVFLKRARAIIRHNCPNGVQVEHVSGDMPASGFCAPSRTGGDTVT